MILYAASIFLSAFLLFQVQPLLAKYILPWFGGGPAVWTACMLFFQAFLVAGYGLVHFLGRRLRPHRHAFFHIGLVAVSLCFIPIAPEGSVWKPTSPEAPTFRILLLLTANVGIPYLLLSTTSPLLQRWYAYSFQGRSPYRLYALSNAGSLLGLLSYPFLIEPNLVLSHQVGLWSGLFIVFAGLSLWCALSFAVTFRRVPQVALAGSEAPSNPHNPGRISAATVLWWILLPAFGSAMLLAGTNELCQEVAAVPFLWVIPLTLYLLTFIICFDRERLYDRRVFAPLFYLTLPLVCYALKQGVELDMILQIVIYSLIVFLSCMLCHGELVRKKPAPRSLTGFYLAVAAGGALGGVFVAVVAPRVFSDFYEFRVTLAGIAVALFCLWLWDRSWAPGRYVLRIAALLPAFVVTVLFCVFLWNLQASREENVLCQARNFYGVLRVIEWPDETSRTLRHGRILHGKQYLDLERRFEPITYYGPASGIGLALTYHPKRLRPDPTAGGLRVGVIGLGTGTIAAYGEPGDSFRFYEINPEVDRISERYFTYRRDSQASVTVVLGDARVSLERELARGNVQHFDVLAVDAFSSDSIPVHLLTLECGKLYRSHLAEDGLLLLHISNRFLNLNPVARGLAEELGYKAVLIDSDEDEERGIDNASWVILTANEAFLSSEPIEEARTPWPEKDPPPICWTDSFASLWQVLDLRVTENFEEFAEELLKTFFPAFGAQ